MIKILSLKLKEDVFLEMEEITKKMKISRDTYFNKALELYNQINKRKFLKKQLALESKLVSSNSLKILHEFERI
jgi:hypothetical protein